jgi:hypothetical protein
MNIGSGDVSRSAYVTRNIVLLWTFVVIAMTNRWGYVMFFLSNNTSDVFIAYNTYSTVEGNNKLKDKSLQLF